MASLVLMEQQRYSEESIKCKGTHE